MRNTLIALTGILTLASTQCFAIDLNSARSQGLVCEKSDGLLQKKSGGAEVDDMVTKVNAQRLKEYQKVANETGADLIATQKIFGQKLQGQYGGC